jgi:hypothetical protein
VSRVQGTPGFLAEKIRSHDSRASNHRPILEQTVDIEKQVYFFVDEKRLDFFLS